MNEMQAIARISDTGCGLDEAARLRVFEPFWSTKRKLSTESGEGTGLGLAIAHGLVKMLGGSMLVSSELNRGSCFTDRDGALKCTVRTQTWEPVEKGHLAGSRGPHHALMYAHGPTKVS